jgi:hypothetical protein
MFGDDQAAAICLLVVPCLVTIRPRCGMHSRAHGWLDVCTGAGARLHSRAHGWLDVCTGAGARSRSDVLVRRLCACAASDSTAESKRACLISGLQGAWLARPGPATARLKWQTSLV